MRLKCYSAPSMAEAMAEVRHELGDDAIILLVWATAVWGGGCSYGTSTNLKRISSPVNLELSNIYKGDMLSHMVLRSGPMCPSRASCMRWRVGGGVLTCNFRNSQKDIKPFQPRALRYI
jgi:hypothetical protein